MRPSAHHPQCRPRSPSWVYPRPRSPSRVYPEHSGPAHTPQCRGEPAGVVIPPGSRAAAQEQMAEHPCSRERVLPWHRRAAAAPAWSQPQLGWPKPTRGKGGPQNPSGVTASPAQPCGGPEDRAGSVRALGTVPIIAGTKSPCPKNATRARTATRLCHHASSGQGWAP